MEVEGEKQGCYLCCMEKELSAPELRSAAITTFMPIHSYMFDARGQTVTGYGDLRSVAAAGPTSWLEGGLGKFRYGNGGTHLHFAEAIAQILAARQRPAHDIPAKRHGFVGAATLQDRGRQELNRLLFVRHIGRLFRKCIDRQHLSPIAGELGIRRVVV